MPQNDKTTWKMMKDGVWVASSESDLRDFSHRLGMFSDAKGTASHVMSQMWAEIDRLRAENEVLVSFSVQARPVVLTTDERERLDRYISDAEGGDL